MSDLNFDTPSTGKPFPWKVIIQVGLLLIIGWLIYDAIQVSNEQKQILKRQAKLLDDFELEIKDMAAATITSNELLATLDREVKEWKASPLQHERPGKNNRKNRRK